MVKVDKDNRKIYDFFDIRTGKYYGRYHNREDMRVDNGLPGKYSYYFIDMILINKIK